MTQVLLVGERTITGAEIIPLLAGYQMLPLLLRELIVDEAIAVFDCTPEETVNAIKQLNAAHQLIKPAEGMAWAKHYGMTPKQKDAAAIRQLRIEKFKLATWGPKLESYFLSHKSQLDQVIYSLIRTQDAEVASELYFRIQAGEQSFGECARDYSTGPEAQTGGLIGPVSLSQPHPTLAKMLSISQPGQLWPPTRLGEWLAIVRLEKLIPAQLDEPMRQQLLNHLFEAWQSSQMQQLSVVEIQDAPLALVAI